MVRIMAMYILNRVKEFRWKQKLTVTELADRSKVRQSTVTKIENGDMMPSQIVMMKISKGLGLPTHVVFKLDWNKIDPSKYKRRKRK